MTEERKGLPNTQDFNDGLEDLTDAPELEPEADLEDADGDGEEAKGEPKAKGTKEPKAEDGEEDEPEGLTKKAKVEWGKLRDQRRKLRDEVTDLKAKLEESSKGPKDEVLKKQLDGLQEAVGNFPLLDEALWYAANGKTDAPEFTAVLEKALAAAKAKAGSPSKSEPDSDLRREVEQMKREREIDIHRREISDALGSIRKNFAHFEQDDIDEILMKADILSQREGGKKQDLLKIAKDYNEKLDRIKKSALKTVAERRPNPDKKLPSGPGKPGSVAKEKPRVGSVEWSQFMKREIENGALD